jgi:hypothetical protein
MNIFEFANIKPMRGLTIIRSERVKKEGSPYYTYTMPALAAADSVAIALEQQFPEARKYFPLDWLQISNNEAANDLLLAVNGNMTFPVPAGTIQTIKNQPFWHVRITNQGGLTTTLNKVVLTFQRQALTVDDVARGVR